MSPSEIKIIELLDREREKTDRLTQMVLCLTQQLNQKNDVITRKDFSILTLKVVLKASCEVIEKIRSEKTERMR